VGAIISEIAQGQITWATGALLCLAALPVGALGGAASAALFGGKHIGYGLSAMMGTVFGCIAALPGVLLGLVAIFLFFSS
jgi:hypothetical protein